MEEKDPIREWLFYLSTGEFFMRLSFRKSDITAQFPDAKILGPFVYL